MTPPVSQVSRSTKTRLRFLRRLTILVGDRISFEEVEGRVLDITLSYTYVDPGDGTAVVIPNQLLVEGVVHNLSTADTQA